MKKNLFSIILVAAGLACFTSCSDDNNDNMPSGATRTVTDCDYDQLSAKAISEFLEFAKTPRYGFHLDKAQAYLMDWAKSHGYQCYTDEYQNVWFDVPATAGMESHPKVILQAHMDQICASAAGETYDYTKVVGEPYYDGDLLKGRKVNLGADDGSGVGMSLALASSGVPHGPLRVLITTNEDYDMSGAQNLSADVLDADYLINIDNEWLGDIAIGCYGGFTKELTKAYQTMATASDMKKVTFAVDGLKGGHSGVEIGNGHLSGSVILDNVLNDVIIPAGGQLVNINCGTYANAIPSLLTVSFAVKNDAADAVKAQLENMIAEYKSAYPEENGKWNLQVTDMSSDEKVCDSQSIADLNYLFRNIAQGVIEKDNTTGRITKSNNIGIVTLTDGAFYFNTYPRTDYSNWLITEEKICCDVAAHLGMNIKTGSTNPCWESDGKDELTQMMVEFHNQFGIKNNVTKAPGGLETAYFSQKKPEMKCVSVGPTIDNAHSIDEALHVSTVKPLMQVLVNVLVNIGK